MCFNRTTRTHGREVQLFQCLQRTGEGRDFPDMGAADAQLALAIEKHDADAIWSLLLRLTNMDFQTKQRRTALYAAVLHNNIFAATNLLERGASMNVLPLNKSEQTIRHCPMLLAFTMGESHEEMQLLFLRQFKVVRPTWVSVSDQQIITAIPKFAMRYSTPRVFVDAFGESGGANIGKDGEICTLSPLMHTLKEIALFGTDPAKCAKTMENVFEMLDKYPAMEWERLKAPVNVAALSLVYAEGSTALGMLVFSSMPARLKQNMELVEMGERLLKLQESMEMRQGMRCNLVCPKTIEADQKQDMAIVTYMNTEIIPKIFTRMLRPMRVALAMATHARLGTKEACCAQGLGTNVIDIIFNVLARAIIESPAVVKEMLC